MDGTPDDASVAIRDASPRIITIVCAVLFVAHVSLRLYYGTLKAIRNRNTRLAYLHAVGKFFAWCDHHRIGQLADIEPLHVAAYIEALGEQFEKPTVKARIAHSSDFGQISERIVKWRSARTRSQPPYLTKFAECHRGTVRRINRLPVAQRRCH